MTTKQAPALRKAGEVIADEARRIALTIGHKKPMGRTARSIRITVYEAYNKANVSAGGPDAPEAVMFEEPRARHPLFGNDKYWYDQPHRPFLEEAAEAKADEAMQAYADELIPQLLDENGL